jgi:glycosyltransferase involved in cell wall biosynthesis
MPKITVILPVHNGSNYLKSSIDSILAQDIDFQLHVLDDGSTDSSAEIAQSTGDLRVRYSKNDGRFGLFKTLNRGFREATTKYVRIWAHDDLLIPGGLEKFIAFADNHPDADMVYSDYESIDSAGNRTGLDLRFSDQRQRTPDVAGPNLSALLFFAYGCLPGNISTVLLTRRIWEKAGGFIEGIQQAPDYDMWFRVSQISKVGFIREKLVLLREHPNQLGRVGQKQMTTVEEEFPIFTMLTSRLSATIPRDELVSYWLGNRGCQHMHWVFKALLSGDLNTARRGLGSISRYGHPGRQFSTWLCTLNGRFFRETCADFFDRQVGALQRD